MTGIDYSQKIPNNVDLKSDKRLQRALERGIGGYLLGLGHHRFAIGGHINVWPCSKCLAPETHGAVRIESLRGAKGADRFGMIETKSHDHALIEIALNVRIGGGNGAGIVAHAIE